MRKPGELLEDHPSHGALGQRDFLCCGKTAVTALCCHGRFLDVRPVSARSIG